MGLQPDKEVINLLHSANLAYNDGDFAAAKAIAQRALTMDPENEATLRLLAMIKMAGNKRRNKVSRMDEDSDVFGSTDKYGLGTYVATKSNQPIEKPLDQLAPWEGGNDPLQNQTTRTHRYEQQPASASVPDIEMYEAPTQPAPRRRRTQQEFPPIVDNTAGDDGGGVPMPTWMTPNNEQNPYDHAEQLSPRATTTPARKERNTRKNSISTAETNGSGWATFNRMLNIFQITPFRLICWVGMLLFFIMCIITCHIRFSERKTPPTQLTQTVIATVDKLFKEKKYDDVVKTLNAELKGLKDPESDSKAKAYYEQSYFETGKQYYSMNGKIDTAIEYFEKSLRCNPQNEQCRLYIVNSLYFKGNEFKKAGSTQEAMKYYSVATEHINVLLKQTSPSRDALILGAELADATNQPSIAQSLRKRAKSITPTSVK